MRGVMVIDYSSPLLCISVLVGGAEWEHYEARIGTCVASKC